MTEPNNTPTPPPTEWEEEFEKLMPKRADEPMSYPQFCAVRDFIRTLLAEQKARMVEVVGKHNALILNEYQNQQLGDERVLYPIITKATEQTMDFIKNTLNKENEN